MDNASCREAATLVTASSYSASLVTLSAVPLVCTLVNVNANSLEVQRNMPMVAKQAFALHKHNTLVALALRMAEEAATVALTEPTQIALTPTVVILQSMAIAIAMVVMLLVAVAFTPHALVAVVAWVLVADVMVMSVAASKTREELELEVENRASEYC